MSRVTEISPVFSEYIPEMHLLKPGKLYISKKFKTAVHLCCCGCGEMVVTNFKPQANGWKLTVNKDKTVSLSPSIGNFQLQCKSHYYITNNKVVWC